MPVYVGPLLQCVPTKKWPWRRNCHMVADTTGELHRLANKMGLKPKWFQEHRFVPHFDLTPGMRIRAIEFGAIELTLKQEAQRIDEARRRWRSNNAISDQSTREASACNE